MRISVIARDKDPITRILHRYGIKVSSIRPDIVIAYGGDGTLLFSEQKYPGVPKLFLYHNSRCRNCSVHDFEKIIHMLALGAYELVDHMKLEINFKGRKYHALNDVNIHYTPPTAMRFEVISGKRTGKLIGDGLVIATPFGSTAYFRSITGRTFSNGIGIAFNNTIEHLKPVILKDNAELKVRIIRGPGVIAIDCNRSLLKLNKGDIITVRKSKTPARLLKLRGLPVSIKV